MRESGWNSGAEAEGQLYSSWEEYMSGGDSTL